MTLRSLRRIVAALALAFVIVGAWAAPAFAHAVLQGTDPGSGATVQRAPKDVTLTFSEPVEASLGAIRVFDSRATRIDVGSPEHPGGDAKQVRASVPNLKDGTYVVTWRVISADAHPVRGAGSVTARRSRPTGRCVRATPAPAAATPRRRRRTHGRRRGARTVAHARG